MHVHVDMLVHMLLRECACFGKFNRESYCMNEYILCVCVCVCVCVSGFTKLYLHLSPTVLVFVSYPKRIKELYSQ